MHQSLFKQLPSVDSLLKHPELQTISVQYGNKLLTSCIQKCINSLRSEIQSTHALPDSMMNDTLLIQKIIALVKNEQRSHLRPVFNLSGTILHTNLGRAVLADAAIQAIIAAAREPVTLEFDVEQQQRGHRDSGIEQQLCALTGAEAACLVNNNAAAVILILSTIAAHKEVIISRGELIEIGGSFRIPDIMHTSQCLLKEVGTTNRTHVEDYAAAIHTNTAALMKVYPSNYVIKGFTSSVTEQQLAVLAQQHRLPLVVDLGSGALVDLNQWGISKEPIVGDLIKTGVDLVCFSGDKLLGGPQAGIIVGKKHWIDQLQKHPLKRALRVDKLTIAALEATLKLYLNPKQLPQTLPTLHFLSRSEADILNTAQQALPILQKTLKHCEISIQSCHSQIGSGALPDTALHSHALVISTSPSLNIQQVVKYFLALPKPVIGRLHHNQLWLDCRMLNNLSAFTNNLKHFQPEN